MTAPPTLRIVRGSASAEELAAVVALLAARSGTAPDAAVPAPSLWAAPGLRTPLAHGPGAWRASALPR